MILHIEQVIDPGTLSVIREKLAQESFSDGTESAGWAARQVKNNQQLRAPHPLIELLQKRLAGHEVVKLAARPAQFVNVMINRYDIDQSYGTHMDDALMGQVRTDMSFTLGLTPLSDYEGGELVIEDSSGERSWRLDAGDVLLYPTQFLHRVNAVTAGSRVAMVGWIESLLREPQQREICFDLYQAMRSEFDKHGKSANFDLLSKTYNNLLRRWSKR
ncbi:Fe2+-dependent dioxygenase [Pseudidiomarina insulisalsae]|uniref:Fe2+-dependent dioxygenase n=1 Tax=Pseudidiomarina insulisalsae TaxID=575789 RepID=A0A432YMC8_9GAMM|nr:Fe2+-dependent dioxygenase [Pseudidiomarina insulisalsae]RUO62151.1 Fe2+-dependent dioxygenase [Pseudidiomarina insulisalsae]